MPSPDEAVAVLDCAFLVGGAGPRVVDLGLEGAVEPFLVEELASVVCRDAPYDRQGLARLHLSHGLDDLVLADVVDVLDDVASRAAVEHHQQSSARSSPGDHRVHLEVPQLLRLRGLLWPVLELPSARHRPRLVRGLPRPSSPPRMVWRLPAENADVSGLDVVVESLQAGDLPVRHRLPDHHPRVVRGAPELQHRVPEEDGHADRELHRGAHVAPALVCGGPCPVDVVLRVRPAVAMPDDGGDRPAPELALPCRERDVVYSREVPQRYPCAPVHVLVPGGPEDFALAVREVYPRVPSYGMRSPAHGVDLSSDGLCCSSL